MHLSADEPSGDDRRCGVKGQPKDLMFILDAWRRIGDFTSIISSGGLGHGALSVTAFRMNYLQFTTEAEREERGERRGNQCTWPLFLSFLSSV
jgi:hypothetical protein